MPTVNDMRSNRVSSLEQGVYSSSVPMTNSSLIDTKTLSRSLKPTISGNLSGAKKSRRNSKSSSLGSLSRFRNKRKTWISANFSKRECFKYVQKKGRGGIVKCGCGKLYEDHQTGKITSVNDIHFVWKPETCTKRLPTDAYGEIEFAEDTSSRKPYIRVCHDTHATTLLKLMQEKWGLNIPNLVISVTGGAKSFYLKPRLKEEFSKGLIKSAISTSAWIITGGTNTGVMKHVGEAVRNRSLIGAGRKKINVIGIATWGNLDNQYKLISTDGGGLYPAYYSTEVSDSTKVSLDSNHSHFVLVDNGTTGEFGVDIEPRSRLEEAISKDLRTESYSSSGAIGIPVVILVLEGGPNTIKQMYEAVKKGVPAVVIDGSGRAADLVAFAYKHLTCDEQRRIHSIDPEFIGEVKRKIKGVWKDSYESIFKDIEALLRDEKMITIFRLDDEKGSNDLDLAILKALLKAKRSNFSGQLKLALAWNRIDVAKSEIFTEDTKTDIKVEALYEPMFTALLDNKSDFVALFLNEGLSLREFLTLDVLVGLYQGLPENSPFKTVTNKILARQDTGNYLDMQIIGQAIEVLMGDRFKSRYKTDINYHSARLVMGQNPVPRTFGAGGDSSKMLPAPWLDLFIWAVLANRRQMAHLVWERGRENLACALMAVKLLKSLAEQAVTEREYLDIGVDLRSHASEFEKIAVGILDEAQKEDDNLAQTLVVKELPNFGYLTCLDIAAAGAALDFISHTTCQALLSRLWMGGLVLNLSVWRVCIGFFMPALIPFVVEFHDENSDTGSKAELNDNILENSCVEQTKIVHYDDGIPIGSTSNLKDCSCEEMQYENVELEHHVESDKDVITKIGDFDADNDDSVDVTLRRTDLGFLGKIANFYQAPFVKFFANVVSYVTFLFLYSYTILTNFKLKPGLSEFFLQGWVLTLIAEEVRQMAMQEPRTFFGKLTVYLGDAWNIVDLTSLSAFAIATVFRYVGYYINNPNYITAARILLSTDVIIFIVRLLQIFSVNKHLGPKLIMIRNMLADLKYFIFILAIFILGYGVAKQAVLYPNSSLGKALVGVVNRPYWQMYGELFIEEILEDQKNCTTGLPICTQPGEEPCSDEYGKWIAPIYMALYMLFTNILLLNLLIAIFNYTFEKVQEDSDKVWKFQRYDLILEYHDRPFLSPPLILFQHCYLIVKWVFQTCQCCGCKPRKGSTMRMKLSQGESEQLSMWEFMAAENYCHHATLRESETLDERVKAIQSRFDVVSRELTDSGNHAEQPMAYPSDSFARPETTAGRKKSRAGSFVDARIARLELKMEKVLELLIQQNQKQAAILAASKGLKIEQEDSGSHKITTIHIKARTSPYSQSIVSRFYVPDSKVAWEVPFPEYMPVVYQAPVVLGQPVWADPNLLDMDPRPILAYNAYDSVYRVDRTSFVDEYEVFDGLPQNPFGRTGVVGRGLLGKWGPNHAADPIVTRWKRSSSGIVIDKGKRVLEFIAIQRKDNHQWAIPGGMVEEKDQVISETLRREFSEEALAKLDLSPERTKQVVAKIDEFFKEGVEVYKGYVDDPRNTDNAWMETVAVNFHDDSGEVFGDIELKAGDDAEAVRWQRVSGNIPLFASHVGILEVVSKMHDAAFY